jgi:glucose/arabinose dehydrogenase
MLSRRLPAPLLIASLPLLLGLSSPYANLQVQEIGAGWANPSNLAFAPDDTLFVAERAGRVKVVRPNGELQPNPVVDLSAEIFVQSQGSGLLGLALDPRFPRQPYLYLAYGVSFAEGNACAYGRVVRYRLRRGRDGDWSARPRPRILLGNSPADGPPFSAVFHAMGSLVFGRDRTLLVAAADGAHPNPDGAFGIDAGGYAPLCFGPDGFAATQDVGSFRAQDLTSGSGAVFRIRAGNGRALRSNPFFDGNARSMRSRVWAYGFRSNFRMALRPGSGSRSPHDANPGTLYVGDVGWLAWEELNAVHGGENFGWPCWEGIAVQPEYQTATPTHHGCGTLPATPGEVGTVQNPGRLTLPILAYDRQAAIGPTYPSSLTPFYGRTIVAGVFTPEDSDYPPELRGKFWFADFSGPGYDGGWIRAVGIDADDTVAGDALLVVEQARFPTGFAVRPSNGHVVYTGLASHKVLEIVFVP